MWIFQAYFIERRELKLYIASCCGNSAKFSYVATLFSTSCR